LSDVDSQIFFHLRYNDQYKLLEGFISIGYGANHKFNTIDYREVSNKYYLTHEMYLLPSYVDTEKSLVKPNRAIFTQQRAPKVMQ
jgi:hypothetical protein